MRRPLQSTVGLVALGGLLVAVPMTPASAAPSFEIRGAAHCAFGRTVQGVYIRSTGGGSGFASWAYRPGHKDAAYFRRTLSSTKATTLYVHVGCGKNSC